MRIVKIAPSILAADIFELKKQIKILQEVVDILHFDIMDGNFVKNISFGAWFVKSIRKISDLVFDIHLMIAKPQQFIDAFSEGDIISFHFEAFQQDRQNNKKKIMKDEIMATIEEIKKRGKKVGIAINPDTEYEEIKWLAEIVDLVVVMSVYPGSCGQKFINETLNKIKLLRDNHPELDIEVDGGINLDTAKEAIRAGANILVSGSFIFDNNKNPKERVIKLQECLNLKK